ncbi:hypothetical protein [Parapedobacter pyrenivorans]|uniref:hypothetical protein n=1 Tax=Parapedobacter pyrenivorans TaxID=1305674 RepID=UPI00166900A3|nr:hypothetical protein [Parapedobacter pyrenivorans]
MPITYGWPIPPSLPIPSRWFPLEVPSFGLFAGIRWGIAGITHGYGIGEGGLMHSRAMGRQKRHPTTFASFRDIRDKAPCTAADLCAVV